jgi:hypothetical protein
VLNDVLQREMRAGTPNVFEGTLATVLETRKCPMALISVVRRRFSHCIRGALGAIVALHWMGGGRMGETG